MNLLFKLRAQARRLKRWYLDKRFDTATPDTIPVIETSLSLTRDLLGNYYEFGLYKGFSFAKAHDFSEKLGLTDMRFFGFDSFEGLPAVEGVDAGSKFTAGKYSCSFTKVSKNLKSRMKGRSFLIPGFFDKTLTDAALLKRYDFGPARVVLVDCDLYSSTKDVMSFIGPRLQHGTVIIFDDWNCFDADDDRGERLAAREFLAANPSIRFKHLGDFGWHGAYFRVSRA